MNCVRKTREETSLDVQEDRLTASLESFGRSGEVTGYSGHLALRRIRTRGVSVKQNDKSQTDSIHITEDGGSVPCCYVGIPCITVKS
jgi:hypothetical protein